MSKELKALQIIIDDFRDNPYSSEERDNAISIIRQALQDFQWLKSHICWDLLDHLNTEDKLKLLEIMGVNYD